MNDYTCPQVSTLGILAPMNPMQPERHYNSWVGPLVTSDWDVPVHDMGHNFQVSEPATSRTLRGVDDAMRAFNYVNFLFPV
jgi:hypothetical protein